MRGLAVAQLMSNRGDPGWAPAQGTIARAQTRLALVQAKIDAKRAVSTRVHSWCAMALGVRLPPHCLRPRMEIGTSRTSNNPARVFDAALQNCCPPCAKDPVNFSISIREKKL